MEFTQQIINYDYLGDQTTHLAYFYQFEKKKHFLEHFKRTY